MEIKRESDRREMKYYEIKFLPFKTLKNQNSTNNKVVDKVGKKSKIGQIKGRSK